MEKWEKAIKQEELAKEDINKRTPSVFSHVSGEKPP